MWDGINLTIMIKKTNIYMYEETVIQWYVVSDDYDVM